MLLDGCLYIYSELDPESSARGKEGNINSDYLFLEENTRYTISIPNAQGMCAWNLNKKLGACFFILVDHTAVKSLKLTIRCDLPPRLSSTIWQRCGKTSQLWDGQCQYQVVLYSCAYCHSALQKNRRGDKKGSIGDLEENLIPQVPSDPQLRHFYFFAQTETEKKRSRLTFL